MKATTSSIDNNIMFVNNGFISAIARPNCVDCYKES